MSTFFPKAKILISFRRHDTYIVSSYKQFLQKGGTLSFEDFFDLDHDKGFIKRDDLLFRRKIESIEKHFGQTPFVFLHEEIVGDLNALLKDMERFFDARAPSLHELKIKYPNKGVKYYPSKLLILLNKLNKSELNPHGLISLDNRYTNMLKIDPRTICQYWLSFLPDRPMISRELSQKINNYFRNDWEYICSYVSLRKIL